MGEKTEGISEESKQNLILSLKGVGPISFEKLTLAGYTSLEDIASSNPRVLASKTDFSESFSKNLILEAKKYIPLELFETAKDIKERRDKLSKISTYSKNINDLLNGGIETQSITEFFGESSAGKTQLCHQLAAICPQKKELGGLDGLVLIIDCENTFRPSRIEDICNNNSFDPSETLDKIFVTRVFNSNSQILILDQLEKFKAKNKIKLIIIDSITTHFRSEYLGRGFLSERQQLLNSHLKDLHLFSIKNDCAIVITNQVMSNPDAMFGPSIKPIGGNVLAHAATHRIQLKRGVGIERKAKIISSPDLEGREILFKISRAGIVDK